MPFDGKAIPTPIADLLRKVFPSEDKWCRLVSRNEKGQHCLIGALYHNNACTEKNKRLLEQAIRAIDPTAGQRAKRSNICNPRSEFIALWNNAAETTFADITRAIDALAEIERQRALVNA